jgi:hypothetical protein
VSRKLTLIRLLEKKRSTESEIQGHFYVFSNECQYKRPDNNRPGVGEWVKCTHDKYRRAKYASMSPCCPGNCPEIN